MTNAGPKQAFRCLDYFCLGKISHQNSESFWTRNHCAGTLESQTLGNVLLGNVEKFSEIFSEWFAAFMDAPIYFGAITFLCNQCSFSKKLCPRTFGQQPHSQQDHLYICHFHFSTEGERKFCVVHFLLMRDEGSDQRVFN